MRHYTSRNEFVVIGIVYENGWPLNKSCQIMLLSVYDFIFVKGNHEKLNICMRRFMAVMSIFECYRMADFWQEHYKSFSYQSVYCFQTEIYSQKLLFLPNWYTKVCHIANQRKWHLRYESDMWQNWCHVSI